MADDQHTIDCSSMNPIEAADTREMNDAEIDALSAQFVSALGLPITSPARQETLSGEAASNPTLFEQNAEEIAEANVGDDFNKRMEVVARLAEDVVKTWMARIYVRELKELFPDGLIGYIGSVRMTPGPELLEERKANRRRGGRDEETRGEEHDAQDSEDALGWELRLAVVGPEHRMNIYEWQQKDPAVLNGVQSLLKTAYGYIQYAREAYELPNAELLTNKVIPSPWGTLYVLGAPEDAPQIGVIIERPRDTAR